MRAAKLLLALLALPLLSYGQQQIRPDTAANKPAGKTLLVNTGLIYLSDLTYAGRRDSASVPVLLPMVSLISTKGYFISAIGYFDLNGSSSQVEGLSITPGYVFSFDKNKWYGGVVSATKYFITGSTPFILSSFDATLDGQLHANPQDIVKITAAISYRFDKSGPNDILNDIELSKDIWLYKDPQKAGNGFKITPDVMLYAGTQSFTKADTSSSSVVNQVLGNKTITTQQTRSYQLLALSASMQFAYNIKTWAINFTPYIIQPYNSGQNGSYFLYTVGVNATF